MRVPVALKSALWLIHNELLAGRHCIAAARIPIQGHFVDRAGSLHTENYEGTSDEHESTVVYPH